LTFSETDSRRFYYSLCYLLEIGTLCYQLSVMQLERKSKFNSRKIYSSYYWRARMSDYFLAVLYFLILTDEVWFFFKAFLA
jgi:hypothetical protein